MTFIKNTEDFICDVCGKEVKGNGYTNHCPSCLWSKHVDNEPGDRKADCGGLMKPVGYEKMGDKERIVHVCVSCGFEHKNKLAKEDDRDVLVETIKKQSL